MLLEILVPAEEWMEAGGAPSAGVRFVDLPGLLVAQKGGRLSFGALLDVR